MDAQTKPKLIKQNKVYVNLDDTIKVLYKSPEKVSSLKFVFQSYIDGISKGPSVAVGARTQKMSALVNPDCICSSYARISVIIDFVRVWDGYLQVRKCRLMRCMRTCAE